jgi:hypothetical protein
MSERVVRTLISATSPGTTRTLIYQFLLPPVSLLHNRTQLSISKDAYSNYWPDSTVRAVSDAKLLQDLLESGAGQTTTLLLLAHQAYDHLGWIGWAHLMRNMSDESSFGIAYMYVFPLFMVGYTDLYSGPTKMLNVVEIVLYTALMDSTISSHSPMHHSSHSQIICLNHRTVPLTIMYFNSLMSFSVLDVSDLTLNTTLSAKDIAAILAINERSVQQARRGAEAIQGGQRYPGQAVPMVHAYDEF